MRVRDTSITVLEPSLRARSLFALNPTSTNPKKLRVKPVNAAASRASSLRLSLIIRSDKLPLHVDQLDESVIDTLFW